MKYFSSSPYPVLSLRQKKELGEEIKSVITKEVVTKKIARLNIKKCLKANMHLSVALHSVIKRCSTKIATECQQELK